MNRGNIILFNAFDHLIVLLLYGLNKNIYVFFYYFEKHKNNVAGEFIPLLTLLFLVKQKN